MTPSPSEVAAATDAAMSATDWIQLAAVPVLTGLFALLGGWLGSKIGKATEHQQWLRNQKHEAYVSFLNEARDFLTKYRSLNSESFDWKEFVTRIRPTNILILAPEPIREAATSLHGGLLFLCLHATDEERRTWPSVKRGIETAEDDYMRLEELCRKELRDLKVN
ncbi:hypothetical protein J2W21_003024 [Sinomonas atrocyanea]|uniref:hypothetical protein n=1 Tax=Sinomonas atrocyanea TaxID=37927 RepID=UPI0027808949|nr:hypothetical protein [Sinomonas atrocyanea]MDP9885501.1 hypothetical protein [Sinomonas atrocyanea]